MSSEPSHSPIGSRLRRTEIAPSFACHATPTDCQISPTFARTLKDGSPWAAVLLIGVGSLIPVFVFTTKTSSIVGGATADMYVAYFLIMTVTLIYRFRGWPKVKGWFALGRWGIAVNIVAVVGTGLTALNLLWPRPSTNPTYNQIAGTAGGFFLKDIPMAWLIVGLPLLIGVIFYVARHKRIHDHALAIEGHQAQRERSSSNDVTAACSSSSNRQTKAGRSPSGNRLAAPSLSTAGCRGVRWSGA